MGNYSILCRGNGGSKKSDNLPKDCSERMEDSNPGGLLTTIWLLLQGVVLNGVPFPRGLSGTSLDPRLSDRPLSGQSRDHSCLPISILPLSLAGEHCELELSRRQNKSLKLSSVEPEGRGHDWSSSGYSELKTKAMCKAENEKGPMSLNVFCSHRFCAELPVSGLLLNESRCRCFRFTVYAANPSSQLGRQRAQW